MKSFESSSEKLEEQPQNSQEREEGKNREQRGEETVEIKNIGKRKSVTGDFYLGDRERLIMGEPIPASERKTFTPQREYLGDWISGSIGFLDFVQTGDIISVSELGLEPEFWGKGHSNKLIEAIEKLAEERNIKTIEFVAVDIVGPDTKPMIGLLEKYGYKPTKGYNPEIFVKSVKR